MRNLIVLCLVVVVSIAWSADNTAAAQPTFQTLLAEGGVAFTPPPDYDVVEVPMVERFPFDKAIRSPNGAMQVLYAVRPISRLEIEYNDPHSSAPNPNHIFPLVFESLTGVFSAARKRFNADWASATTFDVDPDIVPDYRLGFLVAAHKNNKADIYTLFLYNDPELAKKRIDALLTSMVFQAGD